ncbi:MAG: NPCBM/NEW2 domain-containing protein [Planctomyces sp.]|nr:NPCBM/NEW2 domain-containing protein [Planctomyces sp.]
MNASLCVMLAASLLQPVDNEAPSAGETSRTVTVETLDGESISGSGLTKLSSTGIELTGDAGTTAFDLQNVQSVRWSAAEGATASDAAPAVEVSLPDGSRLGATSFQFRQRAAAVETSFGPVRIPGTLLRSVRLAAAVEDLAAAWAEYASRETRNDLLIVRKGEALDFVAGVIGDVTDAQVTLLVRDREVPVPRDRVYGLVFASGEAPAGGAIVSEVQTTDGQRLMAREVSLDGDVLQVRGAGELRAAIPLSQVAALDFTLGKVKSLAELPRAEVQHVESLLLPPSVFAVHENQNAVGQPLRIGNRDFARGLWLHSGVTATFRVGREYRRLSGVIGIDGNPPELARAAPELKVVISGDGKPLQELLVKWSDAPQPLDVDIQGVRELEIRVQPQHASPGPLEHVVIGDARVIK